MALNVGVNSYVSVAEADTYFAERFGYASWELLTESLKEQALITATAHMDTLCTWSGSKTDPTQPLAFPRNGASDAPQAIKNAQCEIAFTISVAGSAVVAESDVLTSLRAGDVELQFKGEVDPTGGLVSDYGKRLLSQFGTCMFGRGARLVPMARS